MHDLDRLEARYYVGVTVSDEPGVLASIPRALGDHGVSIAAVTQKECDADVRAAELVITMHGAREGAMREARLVMERLSSVTRADSFRRAEGLANGR